MWLSSWFKKKKPPIVTKPPPLIRGKLLVQLAHDEEQIAKMPKGYKLVAITGVLCVPTDSVVMANGQLSDLIGTVVPAGGDFEFPFIQLNVVATHNIVDQTKGKELGDAFNLPIWKF